MYEKLKYRNKNISCISIRKYYVKYKKSIIPYKFLINIWRYVKFNNWNNLKLRWKRKS